MRLLHDLAKIHATFDDPNLVSRAGLVPVMALAERAGLADLAGEHMRIGHRCGVNPQVKVPGIVARMTGGADSVDDLDLLRHGGWARWLAGAGAVHAGSFLRSFTRGNVLQLGKANRLCWRSWPAAPRYCWARTCWPLSISTRSKSAFTGTRSKAPRSATPRSRARAC